MAHHTFVPAHHATGHHAPLLPHHAPLATHRRGHGKHHAPVHTTAPIHPVESKKAPIVTQKQPVLAAPAAPTAHADVEGLSYGVGKDTEIFVDSHGHITS